MSKYELGYTEATNVLRSAKRLNVGQMHLFTNQGSLNEPLGATAGVHENSTYTVGRQRSNEGVWFADVVVEDSSGSKINEFPVAIKPVTSAKDASAQIEMANKINAIGNDGYPDIAENPVMFVPVGLVNTGELSVATRFEPQVVSLDNVLWEKGFSHRRITNALVHAAATLVFLQFNKICHGDYQVKNTATDGIAGRIIDITSTRESNDCEDFVRDVETYVASVLAYHSCNGVTLEQLEQLFIGPYKDCIADIFPISMQGDICSGVENTIQKVQRGIINLN